MLHTVKGLTQLGQFRTNRINNESEKEFLF